MLDTYTVEDNRVTVQVRVISLGLAPGRYKNALYVQTNGGKWEVPVLFSVRAPVERRSWWERLF